MSHRPGHRDPPQNRTTRSYWKSQTSLPPKDAEELAAIEAGFDKLQGSTGSKVQELIARAVALSTERKNYAPTKAMLDYGFDEVDADGKREIIKWMASTRSYSEMPPGALRYVLMLGFVPVVGGFQAGQDVTRDVINDEVSGWTALDAASIPLEFLPIVGGLVGMVRHMDDFGEMGKLWRRVEKMRADGLQGPELQRALEAEGVDPNTARRMTGLGEESVDDFIGAHGNVEAIGAQPPRIDRPPEPPPIERPPLPQAPEVEGVRPPEVERRGVERGLPDDETIERANRMMEDMGIPDERTGAEPAHWGMIREAAFGRQDVDLNRMADIEAGKANRGKGYEEVAVHPEYAGRRFAPAGAEDFHKALSAAEEANPRVKDFHTVRSLEEWAELEKQGAKFFVNETGTAGGAVLPDGDMVNLFNAGGPKGVVGEKLIPELIKAGGTKADWFDSRLGDLYAPYMDIVDRYPYDPKYGSKVEVDEYSRFGGGEHPETGARMADVAQGQVKPEVRQQLGLEPLDEAGGWAADRARHERALTDFNSRQALGFDPSEIMDISGQISKKFFLGEKETSFGRKGNLRKFLEEKGALEPDSPLRQVWNHYIDQLDPASRARIGEASITDQTAALVQYSRSLPPETLAAITAAGHRGRGWYEATAKSLARMFGEDAPQVGALIAALSPNVGVPANNRMAMDLWVEWVKAGKPRDPERVATLFDMVRYNKGEDTFRPSFAARKAEGGEGAHGVVSNALNEVQRVLGHDNPVEYYSDLARQQGHKVEKVGDTRIDPLAGPKTSPFFANLLGELSRFTNDTHMNRLNDMKTNSLTGREVQTAAFNDAANVLNRHLGIDDPMILDVANMQEIPWGVGRELGEMAGQRYGVEDLLFPGGGELDVSVMERAQAGAAKAEDIAELMVEPETAENLRKIGIEPEEAAEFRRTGMPTEELSQGMEDFWRTNPEYLRRLARRMDMHYRGDHLMSAGGLLAGGLAAGAARQSGLLQPPQEGEEPALFRGQGLLPPGT
jgi:hypothetical protein